MLHLLVLAAARVRQTFGRFCGGKGTGKTGSVPVQRRLRLDEVGLARILEAVRVGSERDVASSVDDES